MRYEEMPVATEEQCKEFLEEASKFLENTSHYSSYKNLAKTAIADFLAYKSGVQLIRYNPTK